MNSAGWAMGKAVDRKAEAIDLIDNTSPDRTSSDRISPVGKRAVSQPAVSEFTLNPTPFAASQTDAVAWLQSLADATVDLVITDPPYESLEKHRAIGTTTRLKQSKGSSNPWFQIFPNERFEELFSEIYRVLKRDRHFYLFCDAETMFVAKPIAEAVGFKFWKPLVWDKQKIGMGYHYRSRYEFILFFEKGKRKLNDLGIPDVLAHDRVLKGYPTEKPVGVSEILVQQSTQLGELVIDPFMGSGSVGVAALKQRRQFWGNDISDEALMISRQRLTAYSGGMVINS
jgi:site-specific DNA-methyltransferase (adenine-specific)